MVTAKVLTSRVKVLASSSLILGGIWHARTSEYICCIVQLSPTELHIATNNLRFLRELQMGLGATLIKNK